MSGHGYPELSNVPFKYIPFSPTLSNLNLLHVQPIPEDLDLTLERDVIRKAIESIGAETKALEERLKRRQGREARARDEARRRAPGLSEQGDILQPVKAPNPRTDSNSALQVSDLRAQPPSPSPLKPVINIHEFENAILAPTDPWESQKEKGDKDYDLTMLREVMGGPSVASSSDTSPMKSVEQTVSQVSGPSSPVSAHIRSGSFQASSSAPLAKPGIAYSSSQYRPPFPQQQSGAPFASPPVSQSTLPQQFSSMSLSGSPNPATSSMRPPPMPPKPANLKVDGEVSRIMQLGYAREEVEWALTKLDSSKIPEFLDAVKQVKQPNYARDDIEDALFTFGMDVANTKRYLLALYTFKEMGFSPSNIKAALLSSNLNTNTALEKLVG